MTSSQGCARAKHDRRQSLVRSYGGFSRSTRRVRVHVPFAGRRFVNARPHAAATDEIHEHGANTCGRGPSRASAVTSPTPRRTEPLRAWRDKVEVIGWSPVVL